MTEDIDEPDLAEELATEEVALRPNESADPPEAVAAKIPADILAKYEIHSFRSAAVVLSESHGAQFMELLDALRQFTITTKMIQTAGGNESDMPKLFSSILRPKGWHETVVQGDLLVKLYWREEIGRTKGGKPKMQKKSRELVRAKYLDGHKIDYVKGRVAFDLEWNSKDQTFDRDLYAFSAFAQCGVIDAAVLLTRSESLNRVFRSLPALRKDGSIEQRKDGSERPAMEKYGASTTWMGKLLYRLNAGRNGGCPVLAIGITPACVSDWSEPNEA